ncbi:MAG: acyl-CoA thioesterase II [Hyphomicrobiales bacterium]|nr:acyl-CoA thioesterase II [Hyphomicrobiales bacterium]
MSAADILTGILDLETLEANLFRGRSPQNGWTRVFGGQVIAQALVAASRTVPAERPVHSLHAYFLLAGDPSIPIIYEVERIRDGGSFTTRRVVAIQNGAAIFAMSASYHQREESFSHQISMPDAPDPDSLPTEEEIKQRFLPSLPEFMKTFWTRDRPIELRPTDLTRFSDPKKRPPAQTIWFRVNGRLPDDPALHQCALAYASDYSLLDTALVAHGRILFDPALMLASLDHALWFHRPFRMDEWLLYAQDSPSAEGARGLCRGNIFRRDGVLVASVAQEGLIRQKRGG